MILQKTPNVAPNAKLDNQDANWSGKMKTLMSKATFPNASQSSLSRTSQSQSPWSNQMQNGKLLGNVCATTKTHPQTTPIQRHPRKTLPCVHARQEGDLFLGERLPFKNRSSVPMTVQHSAIVQRKRHLPHITRQGLALGKRARSLWWVSNTRHTQPQTTSFLLSSWSLSV